MAPNVENAKKYLSSIAGLGGKHAQYSAAYTVTNENLRHAYGFMPKNTENLLTITGSGDHAMFAALYGAKNIDTFDISYNAKCIMDIKTVALHVLDREEYEKLLYDLWSAVYVLDVKNMEKIFDELPDEEQKYLIDMRGKFLFNHGLANYKKCLLPTDTEYAQMREKINTSFNFIWSDAVSIHHHLNKKYDFVHLSNIFDFLDEDDRMYVLANIMKYIKPNGIICFQNFKSKPASLWGYCDMLEQENKEKWNIGKSKQEPMLHVLQRVR